MSVRIRIALLSAVLMTVLLLIVGTGVYFMLQRSLQSDIDQRLENVAEEVLRQSPVRPLPDGRLSVTFPDDFDPFISPGLYIQVIAADGSLRKQAPEFPTGDGGTHFVKPSPQVMTTNRSGQPVYFTTQFEQSRSVDGKAHNVPLRVLSIPLIEQRTGVYFGTMQVAEPLSSMQATMDRLQKLLLLGLGAGFLLTLFGSYVLADRSLSPLARITTTARQIGQSGDLSQRIEPPRTHDEVQELAQTFNQMLARLEDAFTTERRFVSDASHELRTPLTALRGNAEILLRQIEAGHIDRAELSEILTDIRDESERMGRLVQNLLTLARADVGWRPDVETVQLDIVVNDAARVAAPLARNHRFTVQIDEEVDAIGNADQLKQLLLILLDNAFTYTPAGGEVELMVRRSDGRPEIVVRDNGPGMPPEQLERIFDRFYRGEAARERRTSGAGLGLAIAKWIVECHRGEISAESAPGRGMEVVVRLVQPTPESATGDQPAPKPPLIRPPVPIPGRG